MRLNYQCGFESKGGGPTMATVTIHNHNQAIRDAVSKILGFTVTREEFPTGVEMVVRFADDGTRSVTRRWAEVK